MYTLIRTLSLIFILPLTMCNKKQEKKNYFETYDLITLKGELPISGFEPIFPYVSIDTLSDSIIINHFVEKGVVYKSHYAKEGNIFHRKYFYSEWKSSVLFDEYIKDNKIYILEYDVPENESLVSISIFSENAIRIYALDKPITENVSLDSAIKYVNSKKMYSERFISFSKKDDSIQVSIDFQNYKIPEVSQKRIILFKAYNKSLTWWLIFVWQSYSKSLMYYEEKLNLATDFKIDKQ